MTPIEELRKGTELLKPFMEKHGFLCCDFKSDNGSGGAYATTRFASGSKKIELSVRYSLGCVEYYADEIVISHKEYMDAIGKSSESQYPGFSNSTYEAFTHLYFDLKSHCSLFLKGDLHDIKDLFLKYQLKPKKKGFAALSTK